MSRGGERRHCNPSALFAAAAAALTLSIQPPPLTTTNSFRADRRPLPTGRVLFDAVFVRRLTKLRAVALRYVS